MALGDGADALLNQAADLTALYAASEIPRDDSVCRVFGKVNKFPQPAQNRISRNTSQVRA